jgi:hypothetical protein
MAASLRGSQSVSRERVSRKSIESCSEKRVAEGGDRSGTQWKGNVRR